MIVASFALEVDTKVVVPPGTPVTVTPLLMIVCVVPGVFTIPAPEIVRVFPFVSIAKAFAPGSKLIPAAVMGLPSVTVPPTEPTKCATLLSVHAVAGPDVEVILHDIGPENWAATQAPLPAVAGLAASSAQNRSALQPFGSTLKNVAAAMNPAKMHGKFLIDWVVNLIRCVFMGMAIDG
jgi:hypothetical protein